ncbi:MAG: adenylate/guanylate cyclase domain-containing protein [Treponema sp.]|nr:adenylate/guanylate cyclase domain-containing protein [Treponema sp.]
MPKDVSMDQWFDFLGAHNTVINLITILCYLVPVLVCILYTAPIVKLRPSDEKYKHIAVHIPAVYALAGILGWVINFLIELIILIYLNVTNGFDIIFIMISSASSMMFLSMVSFTTIFFTLETLNRNLILPRLYPEGGLSSIKRMSVSSIRNLFLFYFFSAAFFPSAYLGIRMFMNLRYNVQNSYSDILVAMLLLVLGLVLTFILSGFFSKPLKKLTVAANHISEGDFDMRAKISSNDELGVLGDSFNVMAKSLKEKEFIRDTFGKIVTPQVRDYLLGGNVELGGETLSVTVMFCDIRGFTTLSENMAPEKIVSLLNEYFTGLEKCISAHGGVINKYIGDAVMALFGAPIPIKDHAQEAFRASLDMRETLVQMNKDFVAKGFPEIRFGIGLHTGNVLAGNIGAASRMEYTVIGDAVNTASRIEGLCKTYKKDLLISESTASTITENLSFVDEAEIRGRTEKVKLYTF